MFKKSAANTNKNKHQQPQQNALQNSSKGVGGGRVSELAKALAGQIPVNLNESSHVQSQRRKTSMPNILHSTNFTNQQQQNQTVATTAEFDQHQNDSQSSAADASHNFSFYSMTTSEEDEQQNELYVTAAASMTEISAGDTISQVLLLCYFTNNSFI